MIKLTQLLNELGINTPPGRASLTQLKRWKAEIQASDDKMTKIKLALKCAEGVMWIWREKYPNDNRPQAALDAAKAYINNPSEENKQNCKKAADAAYDAWDTTAADDAWDAWDAAATAAYAATYAAAAAANADTVYVVYTNAAAHYAIKALTNHQKERQLNELCTTNPNTSANKL